MHHICSTRPTVKVFARARLWALCGLMLVAATHAARAQCEQVARALVSVVPGGSRTYSGAVKRLNTMPFGPTAGIDMVEGSSMGLPHQAARVHWYKGRIAALHITWDPEDPDEAKHTLSRIVALARPSQAPTPGGPPVSLACPSDMVGELQIAVVAGKSPRQQIWMSLFHATHSQMMADPTLR